MHTHMDRQTDDRGPPSKAWSRIHLIKGCPKRKKAPMGLQHLTTIRPSGKYVDSEDETTKSVPSPRGQSLFWRTKTFLISFLPF